MKGSSSKGVEIYMGKAEATPLELTPTAISAAKPAVVSLASTTGVSEGDAVKVSGTDFKELDGKTFETFEITHDYRHPPYLNRDVTVVGGIPR